VVRFVIEATSSLIFFISLPFGINDLGRNSRKIFEFKGLICKILRNKDLAAPLFKVSEFQKVTIWRHGAGLRQ